MEFNPQKKVLVKKLGLFKNIMIFFLFLRVLRVTVLESIDSTSRIN